MFATRYATANLQGFRQINFGFFKIIRSCLPTGALGCFGPQNNNAATRQVTQKGLQMAATTKFTRKPDGETINGELSC